MPILYYFLKNDDSFLEKWWFTGTTIVKNDDLFMHNYQILILKWMNYKNRSGRIAWIGIGIGETMYKEQSFVIQKVIILNAYNPYFWLNSK